MKRKGFTLVELLIVVAIIGVLAATMSMSAGNATAVAKASTIYSNIRNIKSAALVYQVQQGDQFSEKNLSKAALEDLIDLDVYNKTNDKDNNIQYKIVAGGASGEGAYVICNFNDDGDNAAIADALKNYKDVRIEGDEATLYTVSSFLYHNTPSTYDATAENNKTYDRKFDFAD